MDLLEVVEPLEPEASAIHVEQMGFVEQAVQDGRGGHLIVREDGCPFLDRAVAGDDRAALHVPGRDEQKEQVRFPSSMPL